MSGEMTQDDKFYADFIDNGKFINVSSTPTDLSVFEITRKNGAMADFTLLDKAHRRVVDRPAYLSGCTKSIEPGGKKVVIISIGMARIDPLGISVIKPLELKIVREEKSVAGHCPAFQEAVSNLYKKIDALDFEGMAEGEVLQLTAKINELSNLFNK